MAGLEEEARRKHGGMFPRISGCHDDRIQCIRTWRASLSYRIHKYLCYNTTSAFLIHCAVSLGENEESIAFAYSRMFVPWINILTEVFVLCRMCPMSHIGLRFLSGTSLYILSVVNHILELHYEVLRSIHTLATAFVTQLNVSNRLAHRQHAWVSLWRYSHWSVHGCSQVIYTTIRILS